MASNYWVVRMEDSFNANFISSFDTLEKARKDAKNRNKNRLNTRNHIVVKTYR